MADDDPAQYLYKIQITEDQSERSHEKSRTSSKDRAKWSGSLMDVTCSVMRQASYSPDPPPNLFQNVVEIA